MKIFQNDKATFKYDENIMRPIVEELDNTVCFNWSQNNVLNLCLKESFPGSSTYSADHPIWRGSVGNYLSPIEGWRDKKVLIKAIRNWFYMISMDELMLKFNPDNRTKESLDSLYTSYNNRWGKALLEHDNNMIAQYVLNRFTVAKLAPKVTALSSSKVLQIMEESNLDFSCGVYSCCSGFGGIPEGAKKWAKKYNKNVEIETYDINPVFCNYYGWQVRDVTAQVVKTDKIVICCPPYGPNDEHWDDTPDINAAGLDTYCGFHKWCSIISKYIDAPNYVFIGPTKENKNKSTGLFAKTSGVAYYPEYINGCFDFNIDEKLIH